MIDINEYNRKDIIASCLLEAVDIMKEQEYEDDNYNDELLYEDELYESAGRNGVGKRYRDAKRLSIQKEINNLTGKKNLSKSDVYKIYGLAEKQLQLNNSKKYGTKYFGKEYAKQKSSEFDNNNSNIKMGRYLANESRLISDGYGGKTDEYDIKQTSNYPGVDKYDRSNRKVSFIHEKINRRAARAKSMNESAYDDIELADMILDSID